MTITATPASATKQDVAAHLADLLALVAQGKAAEAFAKYYADDVVMRENEHPPTVGYAANLAREQAMWATIGRFEEFTVLATGTSPEHSFYESVSRYVDKAGKAHRIRQVAVAHWREGRIIDERFVYDSPAVV
jgi:ketosteroid isomerase-like protein